LETTQFDAKLVRQFSASSQPEGCVADEADQRLFPGIEGVGIRVVDANHRRHAEPRIVAETDSEILLADIEGMSLWLEGTAGYLLVYRKSTAGFPTGFTILTFPA
jgi:3-phytase